jgi:hypothetical protein
VRVCIGSLEFPLRTAVIKLDCLLLCLAAYLRDMPTLISLVVPSHVHMSYVCMRSFILLAFIRLCCASYTHRVCAEYDVSQCTPNVTVVTPPWPSTPTGTMFALASAAFPRIGEGTMVRRGKELLSFISRQSQQQDVGASNITLTRSQDGGATWSPQVEIPPSSHVPSRANPGAAVLPNGDIVLTYFVGASHTSAFRVWRKSSDGGLTWTPERNLTDGSHSYMTGAHDPLHSLSSHANSSLTLCTRPAALSLVAHPFHATS